MTTDGEDPRRLSPSEMTAIAAGRFSAIIRAPYLASALTAITFVRTPGLGTVAIDRRLRVYVDPVVLDSWSTTELAGAMIHEVNHVIRGHHDRGPRCTTSAELWNIAGDLEINDDLFRAGIDLPSGVLVPERFDLPDHQLAEWYLTQLAEIGHDLPDPACGSGAGGLRRAHELPEPIGTPGEIPGVGPEAVDRIRDSIARELVAAGSAPAGLERWARARLASDVPWNVLLGAVVRRSLPRGVGHHRHSWSRPRRHNPTDALLPALRGTPVHLAVVIDSSGSMDQHDLDQAASDVAVLRRLPGVDRVTVVSCDTEAAEVDLPRRGGGIALLGGGGTSLGAGLDLVARLRSRPDLVVVITDGHTDWPERRPSRCAPVVALIPAGGPPGPEWMTTWPRAAVTSPVHEVSSTRCQTLRGRDRSPGVGHPA